MAVNYLLTPVVLVCMLSHSTTCGYLSQLCLSLPRCLSSEKGLHQNVKLDLPRCEIKLFCRLVTLTHTEYILL